MTFNLDFLFIAALAYLLSLFLIAYAAEQGWLPQRLVRHPIVYALSLGVYCTSWSYYGSVGFAEQQGFLYLTIYLGPTFVCLMAPLLLAPILRLTREYQLTSLADLFAFRYSSQLAGVLVTLFMLTGTLPYIALQIRAVTESISVLSQDTPPFEPGLAFCLTLILFAILFGARHISPREKHEGLVLAIAFESIIKLAAILMVGLFALTGVFAAEGGLGQWLEVNPEALDALYRPVGESPWFSLLVLSFAAAFLLPRQFHMLFVENPHPRSLVYLSWVLPLFLLLFNLAIPPILWAGQLQGTTVASDYYTLGITLAAGNPVLPTVAFIGGISAASAMVIVTTLALSQMALNHLLLPASYPDPDLDMYGWLLWGRRMLITAIILVSYLFFVFMERSTGLVELGLISFVAVAQFLPGMIGVLLWPGANRRGFLSGLVGGAVIWYLSLVQPMLVNSGLLGGQFDLAETLGLQGQNIWAFATFWSLAINSALFVLVSLCNRQDADEQRAVAACFQRSTLLSTDDAAAPESMQQFADQLAAIIGQPTARQEIDKALADLGVAEATLGTHQLRPLRQQVERNLSGMLGPMLARMIVSSPPQAAEGARTVLADHMRFVEERLEQSRSLLDGLAAELDALRRYHRQVLQDLPLGACSLSAEGEILSWNQALEQLAGINGGAAIGKHLDDLPQPWAALLTAFVRQQEEHAHKTRLLLGDGPRWFSLHKAAIAHGKDNSANRAAFTGGLVILVDDQTEVHTLEGELAHSERLASVGRLAAGVAHEIGNPVTGIACIAQNLRDEQEPAAVELSANDILNQTERIDVILKSLLSYSHGGAVESQPITDVVVKDCVDEAIRLARLSHTPKQLRYGSDCADNLLVQADRQRLLQVLVNLLNNAADASAAGNRITIVGRSDEDQIVLSVHDEGAGIPPDLRERILEPFFTTKQPGEGTGLGLPLVDNIVRDHAGSLSVDGNLPRGTVVTVRLPKRQ